MDAKGDAPAALAAKQPAKKGMRMRVAELDADGNVVMVDKLIGEGTQGSLDDYRSKDNRVNPDGAGEAVAPTTVLAAASAGDLDTLRALLKDGGDSNQAMPRTGTTALMLAAHKGHAECVRCLLEQGADPECADDADGLTALMLACSVEGPGQFESVELLLAASAAADLVPKLVSGPTIGLQRDCDGRSALLYASRRGHTDAVRATLKAEPTTVNLCDESGTSPVAVAAANNHIGTLELLLEHGGDPSLADEMGSTPLHLAVIQGNAAAVTVLLRAGASPTAADDDERTPVSEANDIGDPAILAALGLASVQSATPE